MNIYDRLTQDHQRQRDMVTALEDTSGDTDERQRLFDAFCEEVHAHADAEEQTFYAELIASPEGQEKARHSIAEHKEANDLIKELEEIDMSSGAWLVKFRQLGHDLVHHVDEEENEVFPQARSIIAENRAIELASEFETRKAAEKS